MAKIYSYTANNGYSVKVPAAIHAMIQRGISVRSVNGGLLTRDCKFADAKGSTITASITTTDATVHVHKVVKAAAPKTAPKARVAKTPGKKTNAQLCRERIAVAKKNGETVETVMEYMMSLGQSKSQAKQYATTTWKLVK